MTYTLTWHVERQEDAQFLESLGQKLTFEVKSLPASTLYFWDILEQVSILSVEKQEKVLHFARELAAEDTIIREVVKPIPKEISLDEITAQPITSFEAFRQVADDEPWEDSLEDTLALFTP